MEHLLEISACGILSVCERKMQPFGDLKLPVGQRQPPSSWHSDYHSASAALLSAGYSILVTIQPGVIQPAT